MASRSNKKDGENVEFVQIGVLEAEFDKCRKQLFGELQKAHDRIAELDKEVNQKSGVIVNLNREVTEQKDNFAKNIASKEERLRILSLEVNAKHTKNNELKKENYMLKRKYDKFKEAERKLEEAEQNINALTQSLDNANRQVDEAVKLRDEAEERLIQKVKEHAKLCEDNWNFEKENLHLKEKLKKNGKEQKEIYTLQKTINTQKQNQELMKNKHQAEIERLCKIAEANLTLKTPDINIADLSDDKRPTRLAEEFSELYDNEWTDAFEVMEIKDDRDKTTYMLFLLQRASDICREISDTHIHDIKKGLCHMTFRTKSISAEVGSKSIPKPKANECQEGINNEQSQVNEIIFHFDSLQNDQKKTVMELRKFIEINVSHQIETDVAIAIAAENKIDDVKDETIVKYIKKCVNVCWSMCRHEPPVHIEFHNLQGDQKFDTNVFKPYTKSGKRLHYVVWPALFLHKDGPMLCRGVAQGR